MEFSIEVRVYIEDTDAGGIVYYVNYLKFFERARTEFMRSRGYQRAAFLGEDSMFVVTDVQARYRQPARLDDQLVVTAAVERAGGATIVFRQQIVRGDQLLVDGQVTIALIGAGGGRPRRLPQELRDAVLN